MKDRIMKKLLVCLAVVCFSALCFADTLTDDENTRALWHMDGSDPDWVLDDDSVNSGRDNDLELINLSKVTDSEKGSVLEFDDFDDDKAVSYGAWTPEAVTVKIEMWFKPALTDEITRYLAHAYPHVWRVYHQNGKVGFTKWLQAGGADNALQTTNSIVLNDWNYVVCELDSNDNMSITLNGVTTSLPGTGQPAVENSDIFIGVDGGTPGRDFVGLIGETKISAIPVVQKLQDDSNTRALWHMDGTDTNWVFDDNINNPGRQQNLELIGGINRVSDPEFGTALEFANSADDYGYSRNAWSNLWDNIEVEIWFKPTGVGSTRMLAHARNSSSNAWRVNMSDYKIQFVKWLSSGADIATSTNEVVLNQWNHLVCKLDKNDILSVNLNGVVTELQGTGAINNINSDIFIGRDGGHTGRNFIGLMAEIKISTVGLSRFLTGNWQQPHNDTYFAQGLWHFDSETYDANSVPDYYLTLDDNSVNGRDNVSLIVKEGVNPVTSSSQGPSLSASSQIGFGNCYQFDGLNDRLEANTKSYDYLDIDFENFQVEAWVKLEAVKLGTSNVYTIASQRGVYRLRLVEDPTDNWWRLQWAVNGPDDTIYWLSHNDYPDDGDWHHVAGVYYQGDMLVYLDGELKNSRKGVAARRTSSPFEVGTYAAADNFFGEIDEVRVAKALVSGDSCGDLGFLNSDINHDCYTDINDLMIFIQNWLK